MEKAPPPWTVLLAVTPPLLGELLSTLLSRADLQVSIMEPASSRRVGKARFDVGVHDRPLPGWIEVDRLLRITASYDDTDTDTTPLPSDGRIVDDIDGLRLALAELCPVRDASAVAD